MGGLTDRVGDTWVVFDIDGTREAARQRALPQSDDLPPVFRRLEEVCAPGYMGRKRGQMVRTRITLAQAHRYQWLGSFGNRGNGCYWEVWWPLAGIWSAQGEENACVGSRVVGSSMNQLPIGPPQTGLKQEYLEPPDLSISLPASSSLCHFALQPRCASRGKLVGQLIPLAAA
jgi:hypothetical protein